MTYRLFFSLLPEWILSYFTKTTESSVCKPLYDTLRKYLLSYLSDKFRRSYVFYNHGTIYPSDFSKFPDRNRSGCILHARGSCGNHEANDQPAGNKIKQTKECRSITFWVTLRHFLFASKNTLSYSFSYFSIIHWCSFVFLS